MRTIEEAVAELRKDIHSDVYLGKKTIGTYLDEILEIHSAEKTRWIPCSERLPEENGSYFVTVKRGYVTTAIWVGTAKFWNEVTAWMPLPEPYVPDINIGKMSEIPTGEEVEE